MKKKIGTLYNKPIIIGDKNLVENYEIHIDDLGKGGGEDASSIDPANVVYFFAGSQDIIGDQMFIAFEYKSKKILKSYKCTGSFEEPNVFVMSNFEKELSLNNRLNHIVFGVSECTEDNRVTYYVNNYPATSINSSLHMPRYRDNFGISDPVKVNIGEDEFYIKVKDES